MTSPENHEATIAFFESHGRFGLEHVRFFTQGQMPAVDRATGKVLLASKGRVALSPDGHGGTLAALAAAGPGGSPSCLDEMRSKACGRSSTSRWTIPWSGSPNRRSSACTARPTPSCRSRSSSGSRPTRSWAWW